MSYKVKYHICHWKDNKSLMDVSLLSVQRCGKFRVRSFRIFRNKWISSGMSSGVSRKRRPQTPKTLAQTPKTQTPRIYLKNIYFLNSSQFLSPNVLWSRNVCSFATARKKRDIYLLRFIAVVLIKQWKTKRLKIAADILVAFAGGFFTEEIENTESL